MTKANDTLSAKWEEEPLYTLKLGNIVIHYYVVKKMHFL